jgi:hypothetical protein
VFLAPNKALEILAFYSSNIALDNQLKGRAKGCREICENSKPIF